ncbi:secretory subunit [Exophiala dermatitidis]|uniref:Translocation protein SEC63 n=2 Tax=Exophiala dermatitidis TaxID=5970 RepID=H6C155_EXODN|nr:translocation protein SEC63 [Exophiala dermatitidis NIH/UT8656]KAJ4520398.1 secretory subunit [Exophiala dermatitidis]EHY56526.1 translocation protein SEC63 [Exophiala dermatitidis NIH/UT8656]KAJ4524269.1 secretory subunit [Exophiala dermatitidis]KAJ4525458.1 secretory subunit [Exophiala dermatitidis]KAJ4536773.1 secretory subunit [Exophiala dermatitidis]
MSSSDYNYDDQGQFFPFFMLTMAGLVTVPLTYNILKPSTDLEQTAARIQSDFKPKNDDLIESLRRRRKRQNRKTKRIIAVVLGYAFMAYMIYLIAVTQRTAPKMWDPYDILGVSRSATEAEINRFYKRLSVKYHPDKARPDPAKNETVEFINDRWVEMTKAYKALTDEEIRNNYLLYGNPDGKQGTSIGIALPKWMVEEGNRWFVVAFYGVLLGIILPYTLGKWWYGTQALTKDKVLHASAGNLFREWKEDITEGGVITALSVGEEFKEILKGPRSDAGAAKVEGKVLNSSALTEADKAKLKAIEDPVRRKALALLWAYLARIDLEDAELEKEKYEVAPTALLLNNSFTSITLPFGAVNPLLASYHTSQNIIQAVAPGWSPLLQLPNITPEIAAKISTDPKTPMTLQKFMTLAPSVRRTMCSELSESQHAQAMKVASQIPHLQIAKAFFKVVGERVVTPSSLVQLVIKARVIPPGTKDVPAVNPLDLEDIDPDEGDLDALHGRKPAKSKRRKLPDGRVVEDDSKEGSVQPPLAHAPYFAADHAPRWHVFLSEARTGRIAVPPFTFTAFDRLIFNADGTPTFNMLTFKFPFQAPAQVHAFPFVMHLVCDSYIGLDSKVDVVLDVKDVSEANVVESDDEISEPDEDTLAGQLQAMKTGGLTGGPTTTTTKRKKKKTATDAQAVPVARSGSKKVQDVDDSDDDDDDSDTEGSDDDTSDTDTDTDTETEDEDS